MRGFKKVKTDKETRPCCPPRRALWWRQGTIVECDTCHRCWILNRYRGGLFDWAQTIRPRDS